MQCTLLYTIPQQYTVLYNLLYYTSTVLMLWIVKYLILHLILHLYLTLNLKLLYVPGNQGESCHQDYEEEISQLERGTDQLVYLPG